LLINSKGLRDREYPYEKTPGTKRILVLGDSYTWGYGVGNNERFTDFLEQQLEECEVLNSGVSGYGTDQEYLWFRSEGVKYQPDLVILAFFVLNDPMNNVSAVQYGLSKPLFLDTNLSGLKPPVFRPDAKSKPYEKQDELVMSVALIKAIADKCDQIGSRFVLMKFGFHGEKESQRSLAFDRDLTAAVAQQMPNAHLLDLDAECTKRELTFFKMVVGNIDGHWNAWGHKKVGEILRDYVIANRKELLE
ncbi:MAG: SGNH/GDSL hydrolase family protein, partial [Limisphaerales bacterium]